MFSGATLGCSFGNCTAARQPAASPDRKMSRSGNLSGLNMLKRSGESE